MKENKIEEAVREKSKIIEKRYDNQRRKKSFFNYTMQVKYEKSITFDSHIFCFFDFEYYFWNFFIYDFS